MRRFAATIRGFDYIKSFNPVERWNIDNLDLSGIGITAINGLYNNINLISPNSNARPLFQNNEINYIDTNEDYSFNNTNINTSNFLTNIFEFIIVCKPISGQLSSFFSIGDERFFRSNLIYLDGKFSVLFRDDTIENLISTQVMFEGDSYYVVSFSSNGSLFKIHINNPVTQETTVNDIGVNNGVFYTNQNAVINKARLFTDTTNTTRPMTFKDSVFFNRQLTPDERERVFNQYNQKYNIY